VVRKSFDSHGNITGDDTLYVGPVLLDKFKKIFLERVLAPSLLVTNEQSLSLSTNNTSMILEALTILDSTFGGGQMLSSLVDFLIGDSLEAEVDNVNHSESRFEGIGMLKTALIHRIDSMSDTLSISTAELFSRLLDFNDPRVLHILVIRNLIDGNYLSPIAVEGGDGDGGGGGSSLPSDSDKVASVETSSGEVEGKVLSHIEKEENEAIKEELNDDDDAGKVHFMGSPVRVNAKDTSSYPSSSMKKKQKIIPALDDSR
jgi:hypothetical protein